MKTIKYYELDVTIRNKKLKEALGDDYLLVNFETLERMEKYITDLYNKLKKEFHLKECIMWYCQGKSISFNENAFNCAELRLDNGNLLGIDLIARCKKIHITE